jgi:hypothetical protein
VKLLNNEFLYTQLRWKSERVDRAQLNINGTLQLLVYADDVNILGESVHTIKEKMEVSKEIGLDLNADKTKYMVISRE